ncbi:MAG: hypothetical protein KDJ34_09390 [Candidatus Competibacteraceae bacterium]|nr:hypothetical protein [Candidatus Competibacteraceae bacterium]
MAKITRKHKVETRTISVKVPLSLFEDLRVFRQELQDFDNTMILNVNELIVTALKRDLRTAREELKRLQETPLQPPAVMQTTADSTIESPSTTPPPPTTTSSSPTAHKVHST